MIDFQIDCSVLWQARRQNASSKYVSSRRADYISAASKCQAMDLRAHDASRCFKQEKHDIDVD